MKVLVLDNADSFVYNLAQYVGELGGEPVVRRSSGMDVADVMALKPERVIISPGPCTPADSRYFGVSSEVLRTVSREVPTLGVCLGHQGMAHAYGGRVVRAGEIMHGKAGTVFHDGRSIYDGVPSPIRAGRYHSLVVEAGSLPDCFSVSARSEGGLIMGIRHRDFPMEGVQFHPESVLTGEGKRIMKNFLEAGVVR
ncbi:MAG: aminodeoxychorismate/anthranilate synthase component II [Nitrososphaerota archaeon]|nr:aminodeoxychorismate/anthranilate synthase component II [Nitrososphaerota archaeon]MDG6939947.1 aminodeoxychorismate/anthranilate synthase component II [Nitrososphaerota archaeon]